MAFHQGQTYTLWCTISQAGGKREAWAVNTAPEKENNANTQRNIRKTRENLDYLTEENNFTSSKNLLQKPLWVL